MDLMETSTNERPSREDAAARLAGVVTETDGT